MSDARKLYAVTVTASVLVLAEDEDAAAEWGRDIAEGRGRWEVSVYLTPNQSEELKREAANA